jgi:hypothetical protein
MAFHVFRRRIWNLLLHGGRTRQAPLGIVRIVIDRRLLWPYEEVHTFTDEHVYSILCDGWKGFVWTGSDGLACFS